MFRYLVRYGLGRNLRHFDLTTSHALDCNGFGDSTSHRINILSFLQCEIVIYCSIADNANPISNMALHPLRDRGATLHVSSQQSMDIYSTERLRNGSALSIVSTNAYIFLGSQVRSLLSSTRITSSPARPPLPNLLRYRTIPAFSR